MAFLWESTQAYKGLEICLLYYHLDIFILQFLYILLFHKSNLLFVLFKLKVY